MTAKNWIRLLAAGVLALLAFGAAAQTCSIPGQAGSNTAINAQPNSFFPGSVGAAAGATSISVGAGTGVNRGIAAGDLLLIIQMQGADINATDSTSYGDGTGGGGTPTVAFGAAGYAGGAPATNFYAGNYEWAVAASAVTFGAGGSVSLSAPLQNSYFVQAGGSGATAYKRVFQVVRVPQYARATLTGNLTVQGWNGSTGGVLVMDVTGDLNLAGFTIDGNGRGFRGGGSVNGTAHNTTCTANWNPSPAACWGYRYLIDLPGATGTAGYWGASKGEGTAGTPGRLYSFYNTTHVAGGNGTDGYPNGDMGRGAPGNAGGGGNAHNSGGGGGAGGGAGGKGGNTWNSSTNGNVGQPLGGFGGAPSWTPVSGINVSRLFLGGGGGAGDLGGNGNAVPNGSGGAGGALVVLHASRIVGGGATINLNGEAGRSVAASETDGAGGGGAGGTAVIKSNSLSGAVTVNANGGAGGAYTAVDPEQDGAGGGGGGGVLISNLGGIGFNANGGAAGASASLNCAPAAPAANCGQAAGIASAGSSGYAVFAPGVRTGYECLPALTVTKSTNTPSITNATSATASYVINISNAGGGARFVDVLDWSLPPGWVRSATAPTYQYSPAGAGALAAGAETSARTTSSTWAVGATPLSVPASGSTTLTWSAFALPPLRAGVASSVTVSFIATIPNTATAGTYHNPAAVRFLDSTRAAASTATVAPATGNTSNRAGTSYGSTVYSQYNGSNATNVAGSQHSGLTAGPTTEDVTLLPNLRVLKSAPGTTSTAGSTFTYVLAVQNVGRPVANQVFAVTQATGAAATAIASNPLRITDTLPTGFTATAVTASPSVWACGTATAQVTCAASNPNADAVYPITIGTTTAPVSVGTVTVTVLPRSDNCAETNVTNTVTLVVASIGETSTSDNIATLSHGHRCGVNLQLSKTNGTDTLGSGSTTAYTITISNLGPSAADGAVLADTVSAGLSCTTATCVSTSGGASCPVGTSGTPAAVPNLFNGTGIGITSFPGGGSVTLSIQCTVTATGS